MGALDAPICDSWIIAISRRQGTIQMVVKKLPVPLANDGAEGSLVGVSAFGVVSTGTEMKEQRKIIV